MLVTTQRPRFGPPPIGKTLEGGSKQLQRHTLLDLRPRSQRSGRAGITSFRTIAMVLEHLWNKTPVLRRYFSALTGIKAIESSRILERAMGIEPTSAAWEAAILPLNHARSTLT